MYYQFQFKALLVSNSVGFKTSISAVLYDIEQTSFLKIMFNIMKIT